MTKAVIYTGAFLAMVLGFGLSALVWSTVIHAIYQSICK